jgi:hypothetical protein
MGFVPCINAHAAAAVATVAAVADADGLLRDPPSNANFNDDDLVVGSCFLEETDGRCLDEEVVLIL